MVKAVSTNFSATNFNAMHASKQKQNVSFGNSAQIAIAKEAEPSLLSLVERFKGTKFDFKNILEKITSIPVRDNEEVIISKFTSEGNKISIEGTINKKPVKAKLHLSDDKNHVDLGEGGDIHILKKDDLPPSYHLNLIPQYVKNAVYYMFGT